MQNLIHLVTHLRFIYIIHICNLHFRYYKYNTYIHELFLSVNTSTTHINMSCSWPIIQIHHIYTWTVLVRFIQIQQITLSIMNCPDREKTVSYLHRNEAWWGHRTCMKVWSLWIPVSWSHSSVDTVLVVLKNIHYVCHISQHFRSAHLVLQWI